MKNLSLLKHVVAATIAVLAILLTTSAAHATHFRYSTMSWEVKNPATPTVVTFRIESAWRRTYPWNIANPSVGHVVDPGFPITISRVAPAAQIATVPFKITVNTVNPAEDW